MSTTEGRKRLQPRMSRGSWRFMVCCVAGQALFSATLTLNKLRPDDGWDVLFFWVYAVWFATNTIYFLYLLRVRRNDKPFWDEEEASRAGWDRRGRQL
jgi:hypothetical protein